MAIKVFGAAYSTYTRSVLIALREKGVQYTLSEVDVFKPIPAEHSARHPWGKIPAIDHDGFQLYETDAIIRYIDEAFPGAALQPGTPRERARMMQAIGIIDSYAYKPMVVAPPALGAGQRLLAPDPGGPRHARARAGARCLVGADREAPQRSRNPLTPGELNPRAPAQHKALASQDGTDQAALFRLSSGQELFAGSPVEVNLEGADFHEVALGHGVDL